MMCLKYISFNNSFTIPDSTDNNFFKLLKQNGGKTVVLIVISLPNMTILSFFNRNIDPVSGGRMENYDITIGKRKAKITNIKVGGPNLYITVRDDKFQVQRNCIPVI